MKKVVIFAILSLGFINMQAISIRNESTNIKLPAGSYAKTCSDCKVVKRYINNAPAGLALICGSCKKRNQKGSRLNRNIEVAYDKNGYYKNINGKLINTRNLLGS
jgi:hypothetical protein